MKAVNPLAFHVTLMVVCNVDLDTVYKIVYVFWDAVINIMKLYKTQLEHVCRVQVHAIHVQGINIIV